MKNKHYLTSIFYAAVMAVLVIGCSSGKPAAAAKEQTDFDRMPKRVEKKVLQKLPVDMCELKAPYDVTVESGTSLDLNVFLAYYGRTPLEIKEWFMFDQYNFEVHYRRLDPSRVSDRKTPFKVHRVKPPKGSEPNRSGVILNRDNKAVLTVNMPFTGEVNPGEKALFEVYIYTTLRTFKLRSNRILIRTR